MPVRGAAPPEFLEVRGRPVFRRTARAVAKYIPRAEVVILPQSAHIVNADDPAGFAAAIISTAQRIGGVEDIDQPGQAGGGSD